MRQSPGSASLPVRNRSRSATGSGKCYAVGRRAPTFGTRAGRRPGVFASIVTVAPLRVCEKTVASEGRSRSILRGAPKAAPRRPVPAGAQEPQCILKYMRIPRTAGTRDPERSRSFHKLSGARPRRIRPPPCPASRGYYRGSGRRHQYPEEKENDKDSVMDTEHPRQRVSSPRLR